MKQYTVAIVGLWNASNFGDSLICANVKYLVEETFKKKETPCKVIAVDMYPDELNIKATAGKEKAAKRIVGKLSGKNDYLKHITVEGIARMNSLPKRYMEYYKKALKDVDYIIFAGGGLIKFKQQEKISIAINAAVKVANEYNIPVAYQACGVEGYNDKYFGCKRLIEAINAPNVQYVSTRDDLKTLETKYKKRDDLVTKYAADSAVWAAEMLGIQKKDDAQVIGLGIARGDIFTEYGVKFNEDQLLHLYVDMIKSITRRGIQCKLFCNGFGPDYKFGKKILKVLDLPDEFLLEQPKDHEQLVEQISNFKGVIALRLHACIISYSLDIPVIGLCWNQKLKHFGDLIGYPERFFQAKDFDSEVIVKAALKAIEEGYEEKHRQEYRMTAINSIEYMFENVR